jgi:hypothetical protein
MTRTFRTQKQKTIISYLTAEAETKGAGKIAVVLPTLKLWRNAAAQTRIVSAARIRPDTLKSVRHFKRMFRNDISEFESYHLSQAVWSLWARSSFRSISRIRNVAIEYRWAEGHNDRLVCECRRYLLAAMPLKIPGSAA